MAGEEGEYRPYREGLARDLCREYAGYTRLSLAEEHGQVAELMQSRRCLKLTLWPQKQQF